MTVSVEQIRETLQRPPSQEDLKQVGIRPQLLLDAWQARGLFKYERVPLTEQSFSSIRLNDGKAWRERRSFYEQWEYMAEVGLARLPEILPAFGYGSVVDFMLETYVSNMRKFEFLLKEAQGEDQNIPLLPKRPGVFIAEVLKGKYRGGLEPGEVTTRKPLPEMSQLELAKSSGLSQTAISNIVTGKLPTRIGSLLKAIDGLPIRNGLKRAAMEQYAFNPKFVSKETASVVEKTVEEYRSKFGQISIESWVFELKAMNLAMLETYELACVEEFLLARFFHTTDRLTDMNFDLDLFSKSLSPQRIVEHLSEKVNIPSLRVLNDFDVITGSLILDAWKQRGLFRPPVGEIAVIQPTIEEENS